MPTFSTRSSSWTLRGAKIGKLTFLALQGEPLAQIGMRIKEVLRQRGPAVVFGYFAEHC